MAAYLSTGLPTPPASFDLTTKVPSWGMMENDQLGDCTCAAAGHLIMEWTVNAGKKMCPPTDKQIVDAYSAITGNHLLESVFIFEGCCIGVQFPISAQA